MADKETSRAKGYSPSTLEVICEAAGDLGKGTCELSGKLGRGAKVVGKCTAEYAGVSLLVLSTPYIIPSVVKAGNEPIDQSAPEISDTMAGAAGLTVLAGFGGQVYLYYLGVASGNFWVLGIPVVTNIASGIYEKCRAVRKRIESKYAEITNLYQEKPEQFQKYFSGLDDKYKKETLKELYRLSPNKIHPEISKWLSSNYSEIVEEVGIASINQE